MNQHTLNDQYCRFKRSECSLGMQTPEFTLKSAIDMASKSRISRKDVTNAFFSAKSDDLKQSFVLTVNTNFFILIGLLVKKKLAMGNEDEEGAPSQFQEHHDQEAVLAALESVT